jgi:hypothetical protein
LGLAMVWLLLPETRSPLEVPPGELATRPAIA